MNAASLRSVFSIATSLLCVVFILLIYAPHLQPDTVSSVNVLAVIALTLSAAPNIVQNRWMAATNLMGLCLYFLAIWLGSARFFMFVPKPLEMILVLVFIFLSALSIIKKFSNR